MKATDPFRMVGAQARGLGSELSAQDRGGLKRALELGA